MYSEDIETLKKDIRRYLLKVRRGTAKTYASVKHVSSSGMSRIISYTGVYVEKGRIQEINLTWYMNKLGVARLSGNNQPYGVRVSGCGMDMIFNTLYNLHMSVWDYKHKINGKLLDYSDTTRYSIV